MNPSDPKSLTPSRHDGFTLVEMLVVIAIMSILMTAGAIGLGGIGGKGVTSGVASAESLFDEARTMAMGRKIRTCVLIAKDLPGNPTENLRRIMVAAEEVNNTNGSPDYGKPVSPDSSSPNWEVSSRGTILPDQTFFSEEFSKESYKGGDPIPDVPSSRIKKSGGGSAPSSYAGSYYIYEFNAEGICSTPGATFVIGAGSRPINRNTDSPRVTASGKSDFGGFTVWRNGQTSLFRSPAQIDTKIPTLKAGDQF